MPVFPAASFLSVLAVVALLADFLPESEACAAVHGVSAPPHRKTTLGVGALPAKT